MQLELQIMLILKTIKSPTKARTQHWRQTYVSLFVSWLNKYGRYHEDYCMNLATFHFFITTILIHIPTKSFSFFDDIHFIILYVCNVKQRFIVWL